MNQAKALEQLVVDGKTYTPQDIRVVLASLSEQRSYRSQDVKNFIRIFSEIEPTILTDDAILYRLSRLAGTTLLEAGFILRSVSQIADLAGDWCEFGVAHGRTSALLAQCMLRSDQGRKLWLYDSFEGLPEPHAKDVLLDDIFGRGSMSAYAGAISIAEQHVIAELDSVQPGRRFFNVVKGWINPALLEQHSPVLVAFAYLDMDFYSSTYDVLKFLVEHTLPRAVIVVDDYEYFSEGVKTAVTEIMVEYPGVFILERPYNDKFVILTRTDN